jgi:hypothetical protein
VRLCSPCIVRENQQSVDKVSLIDTLVAIKVALGMTSVLINAINITPIASNATLSTINVTPIASNVTPIAINVTPIASNVTPSATRP